MRLTNILKHLLKIKGNVYNAEALFDFKRKQNEMATRYKYIKHGNKGQ